MEKDQALDSLNYIKQIIEDTKKTTVDKGIGFIIWGIITAIGLIGTYITIITKNYSLVTPLWIILIAGGWIFSIYESIKNKNVKIATSYTDRVVGSVWGSLGIVMTILGFFATYVGALQSLYIAPFISLQLGIGFFITGSIFKKRFMLAIAIIWWIAAMIMMAFPGLYVLPTMGMMMILFQVIPGIYIYKEYKSQIVAE